jgi:GNAT superfamily N-acetyltransferase
MSREFIELSAADPDPAIACNRGVAFASSVERLMHAPDLHLIAVERGSLVARCSCWWRETALVNPDRLDCAERLGVIGHYAAADADSGSALLDRACRALAAAGCRTAVGPMDGTTWRRYRFIVERGAEPSFFLEPDHCDEWPGHWSSAGFAPLATYTSTVNDDLTSRYGRAPEIHTRLRSAGVVIRPFDLARADEELHRIFELSLKAFRRNFLYSPLAEAEFLAQYSAALPFLEPELVLVAERESMLLGFIFAVPDVAQARRGTPIDTVVVKTLAVDPATPRLGLGGVLPDLVHRRASDMGYRRAIHALMHDANGSRRISNRNARPIRRYALFARSLAARP